MHLLIINGPNLNLLGKRTPDIYGDIAFEDYLKTLKKMFPKVRLTYYQSNLEGELVQALQQQGSAADGVILNAGGYTHTSVAIADAVRAIPTPVVEVHISNILARETFRATSCIAPTAKGVISGFGLDAYRLGVLSFLRM